MIQIFSTQQAFAALKNDGSVVTWGNADYGGDSSPYDASSHPGGIRSGDITSGVTQIFSTKQALAVLKNDGSVVTWGNAYHGGDSSPYDASSHPGGIRSGDIASGVTQIFSTENAFAALKNDGSVVTWGYQFWYRGRWGEEEIHLV